MSWNVAGVVAILVVLVVLIAAGYANAAGGIDPFGANNGRTDSVAEQPVVKTYRIAVIGDSTTSGSDWGGRGPAGWPSLVQADLQSQGHDAIPDVSGRGGSGYVRRGTEGTVFPEEAANVVNSQDNLIVFFGSTNDAEDSPDVIASAARTAYEEARRVAPMATLLVIGPAFPSPEVPGQLLAIRDVLKEESERAGGVFVDPLAEGWFWDGPPELMRRRSPPHRRRARVPRPAHRATHQGGAGNRLVHESDSLSAASAVC
jgi:lysophospholipase L1-like esterase